MSEWDQFQAVGDLGKVAAPPPSSAASEWDQFPAIDDLAKSQAQPDREMRRPGPGAGSRQEKSILTQVREAIPNPLELARMTPADDRGTTFGLSDEISGVIRGLESLAKGGTFREGYDRGQTEERAAYDRQRANAPVSTLARETITGLGSMGPGRALSAATSLGGQLWQGVKSGGALGGAYGFTTGEGGAEERATDAAIGAGAGAGFGVATPLAMRGTRGAWNWLLGKFQADRGANTQATRKLIEAFERDGITPDEALVRLQEWQRSGAKPEALVDAGGDNVRDLVAAASRTPGKGKQTVSRFVRERQAGQSGRVGEDLRGLSANRDYYGASDALDEQAKRAGPLFDEAFAANKSVESPVIDKILNTPAGKQALKDAAEVMQNDMARMGTPDPEMTETVRILVARGEMDPVKGGVAPGLNLRSLHHVRESLWDQAQAAMEKTAMGAPKDTAKSRSLKSLWGSITDEIDRLDATAVAGPNSVRPEGGKYKQARAAYAGPRQAQEALVMGRRSLSEDAEMTAREIADLSPGEKELFRAGLARAIVDKVKGTPDGADAIKRFFGNELARERIAAAFPSPADFNRFATQMQREANMVSTNQRINPRAGSITQPMLAAEGDMGRPAELANLGGDIATGNYVQAGQRILRQIIARPGPRTVDPKVAERIADLATSDPAQAQRMMRDLVRAGYSRQTLSGIIAAAQRGGTRAAVSGRNNIETPQ